MWKPKTQTPSQLGTLGTLGTPEALNQTVGPFEDATNGPVQIPQEHKDAFNAMTVGQALKAEFGDTSGNLIPRPPVNMAAPIKVRTQPHSIHSKIRESVNLGSIGSNNT